MTSSSNGPQEVYVLPLTDSGAPDVPGEYIYLPAPSDYILRFTIEGASSICRFGSLWINIPLPGKAFNRQEYREYKLYPDFNKTISIDIPISQAGAFAFYTTYTPLPDFTTSREQAPEPTRTATYYIDVCPKLTLQNEVLPLDSLSIFSVVSKFMGQYPTDWDRHLQGIAQRNYNMVHFTPLCKRGCSNSPYSLYDQLTFDTECFPNGEQDVADMISRIEKEYGLLGLTDVVWNHTAQNSKWLEEHPEAGYNIETAPYLEPALELDDALLQYGRDLGSLGLPTSISTMEELNQCIEGIKPHVLAKLRLWDYYVVNVQREAKAAVEAWAAGNVKFPKNGFSSGGFGGLDGVKDWSLKQKADFLLQNGFFGAGDLGPRYYRRIDHEVGAALLTAIHGRYDATEHGAPDRGATLRTMTKALDEINLQFYREYDADAGKCSPRQCSCKVTFSASSSLQYDGVTMATASPVITRAESADLYHSCNPTTDSRSGTLS